MRKTLKEEIERIHSLSYGVKNEGFIDSILNKVKAGFKKIDDPKKADFVSGDVQSLYSDLQNAKNGRGLSEMSKGSMEYQKEVESMQIGLILLGFNLPIYGVDGLYGPETQSAVQRFKQSNKIQSETPNADPQTLDILIKQLKSRNITSDDVKQHIDTVTTGGGAQFTDLDLNTNEGMRAYSTICQRFIDTRPPNPLGISGGMLAGGAKQAFDKFHKYVPPELALAQLVLEGGIGNGNTNSRAIRTKNPFNVGNVDSGDNVYYGDVQSSINKYYNLIASTYLGKGRTASDLVQNFVSKNGSRYASAQDYENKLNGIAAYASKISRPVLSSLNNQLV